MADYPDPYISNLDRRDGIDERPVCSGSNAEPATYGELRKVFKEVETLLTGPRARDYGDPRHMHENIGNRWRTSPAEVALKMADLKMARLSRTPNHRDSKLDAIAYLAMSIVFDES